jgi:hypothetical protein
LEVATISSSPCGESSSSWESLSSSLLLALTFIEPVNLKEEEEKMEDE